MDEIDHNCKNYIYVYGWKKWWIISNMGEFVFIKFITQPP
jgi:hypothetical protein